MPQKLTAQDQQAGRLPAGWEYRLPTEAQWEYACRAGTTTEYYFGNDAAQLSDYAWHRQNSWNVEEKFPHAVGEKQVNGWGLHDMHGNVFEWCQDWYTDKLVGGVDPRGLHSGSGRVYRGGSWDSYSQDCRSAGRYGDTPDFRDDFLGFRVALVPSCE